MHADCARELGVEKEAPERKLQEQLQAAVARLAVQLRGSELREVLEERREKLHQVGLSGCFACVRLLRHHYSNAKFLSQV